MSREFEWLTFWTRTLLDNFRCNMHMSAGQAANLDKQSSLSQFATVTSFSACWITTTDLASNDSIPNLDKNWKSAFLHSYITVVVAYLGNKHLAISTHFNKSNVSMMSNKLNYQRYALSNKMVFCSRGFRNLPTCRIVSTVFCQRHVNYMPHSQVTYMFSTSDHKAESSCLCRISLSPNFHRWF